MGTCHCDDFCLLDEEIFGPVETATKKLKCTEFFELGEDLFNVAVAIVSNFEVLLEGGSVEKGLRSVGEKLRKWKMFGKSFGVEIIFRTLF